MNPHPVVKLFDDFYSKYRSEVNKRNTAITKKQRKLWSTIYYNYELDYYTMTLEKLPKRFEYELEDMFWEDEHNYNRLCYIKWCQWLEPRANAVQQQEDYSD